MPYKHRHRWIGWAIALTMAVLACSLTAEAYARASTRWVDRPVKAAFVSKYADALELLKPFDLRSIFYAEHGHILFVRSTKPEHCEDHVCLTLVLWQERPITAAYLPVQYVIADFIGGTDEDPATDIWFYLREETFASFRWHLDELEVLDVKRPWLAEDGDGLQPRSMKAIGRQNQ
jgi:hypothetical protein